MSSLSTRRPSLPLSCDDIFEPLSPECSHIENNDSVVQARNHESRKPRQRSLCRQAPTMFSSSASSEGCSESDDDDSSQARTTDVHSRRPSLEWEDLCLTSNPDSADPGPDLHAPNQENISPEELKILRLKCWGFLSILSTANAGSWLCDLEGRVIFVSDVLERLFPRSTVFQGRSISELMHHIGDDHMTEPEEFVTFVFEQQRSIVAESRDFAAVSGKSFRHELEPFFDDNGELRGFLGKLRDISTVSNLTSQLQTLLANLPNGVLMLDKNFNVIISNPCFASLFGLSEETFTSAVGKPMYVKSRAYPCQLMTTLASSVEDPRRFMDEFHQLLETDNASFKCRRRTADRNTLVVEVHPVVQKDSLVTTAYVVHVVDTSLQERVLEEMDKRRQSEVQHTALKAQKLSLERFVQTTSHDMRTPLHAIGLAMSEIHTLIQPKTDEDPDMQAVQDLAEVINSSVTMVDMIIDNVLDLKHISDQKVHLAPQPMDIADRLRRMVKVIRVSSSAKEVVDMVLDVDADLPIVEVDAARLCRVLLNLLTNALKFTSRGQVTLAVHRAPEPHSTRDGRRVVGLDFSVEDTGRGMSAEDVASATVLYNRSSTVEGGGSGIGLYIVDQTVSVLGGRFQLTSQLDKGTRAAFQLHLPVLSPTVTCSSPTSPASKRPPRPTLVLPEPVSPTDSAPPTASPLATPVWPGTMAGSLHVLVVDDNSLILKLSSSTLRRLGHTVVLAHDGTDALDLLKERDNIDVCLMDVNMKEMDGDVATQRYMEWWDVEGSKLPHRRKVKIIAMTANATAADETHMLSLGCSAFLPKPCKPASLAMALANV